VVFFFFLFYGSPIGLVLAPFLYFFQGKKVWCPAPSEINGQHGTALPKKKAEEMRAKRRKRTRRVKKKGNRAIGGLLA